MELDLKQIGAWLIKENLMEKPFNAFTKLDIMRFCEQIHLASTSAEHVMPHINIRGELVIPMDTHPEYKPWAGGKSILEILEELNASDEVKKKHTPKWQSDGMAEEESQGDKPQGEVYEARIEPNGKTGDSAADRVGRLGQWGPSSKQAAE